MGDHWTDLLDKQGELAQKQSEADDLYAAFHIAKLFALKCDLSEEEYGELRVLTRRGVQNENLSPEEAVREALEKLGLVGGE